jgi:hypothetical protein
MIDRCDEQPTSPRGTPPFNEEFEMSHRAVISTLTLLVAVAFAMPASAQQFQRLSVKEKPSASAGRVTTKLAFSARGTAKMQEGDVGAASTAALNLANRVASKRK